MKATLTSLWSLTVSASRWVELHWANDATAASAAKALLNHTGRYGQPAQLLSDNGSQYVNEVIAEYTLLVGSEHVRTLAYSHEENGIVERANKEVMRHLRAIIFDNKKKHMGCKSTPSATYHEFDSQRKHRLYTGWHTIW